MKASKLSLDLIQVYSVCLVYIIPSEIQREKCHSDTLKVHTVEILT